MKRYYANLLGVWTDITDEGTVEDHQNPRSYFNDNLAYEDGETVAKCFKYDYINIQYRDKNYRIHPSMIQIITE